MNKYIWLVLILFIFNNISGQRNFRGIPIEVNVIPSDSNYTLYISYIISYDRLVFVKQNGYYEGGIEFSVEIGIDEEIVKRESSESKVLIQNYELTNSKEDYLRGLLTMEIDSGKYDFYPQFALLNTKRTLNMPPVNHDIASVDSEGIKPIVLMNKTSDCLGGKDYVLTNYGGAIPFSSSSSNLLIPVKEDTDQIDVVIKREDEILLQQTLQDYESYIPELSVCYNDVLVSKNNNENYRTFMLQNFNSKFNEGKISVTVITDNNEYNHDYEVVWLDRPLSLNRPSFALTILKGIFSDEELIELNDVDEEDYYNKLVDFWSKYDRDTTTVFNEVMNEFYLRVDYAITEYRSVSEANGATTDRGKIYIKFGEPEEVERKYTDQGEILEIWKYKKFNREFIFSDVSGLGNYSLIN